MKNIKGFTLIELLVVMAIIGILYGLASPSISPKNPWRGSIVSLTNAVKLARAKAISTGRPYRIYPTNTISAGNLVLASGNAEFVLEQGINGATCNLVSANASQAATAPYFGGGIPVVTNLGKWVPDSTLTFKFPKSFQIFQYLTIYSNDITQHFHPVCVLPNGYIGSTGFWLYQSDPSIRGTYALILFQGLDYKPFIALSDASYNPIPLDTDGLPML